MWDRAGSAYAGLIHLAAAFDKFNPSEYAGGMETLSTQIADCAFIARIRCKDLVRRFFSMVYVY
jgi:hypothetical protein